VLPGKPSKPVVRPESITAVIMWENGDSGNVPFEKFEIQVLSDGKKFFLLFVTKHRSALKLFQRAKAIIYNHIKDVFCFLFNLQYLQNIYIFRVH